MMAACEIPQRKIQEPEGRGRERGEKEEEKEKKGEEEGEGRWEGERQTMNVYACIWAKPGSAQGVTSDARNRTPLAVCKARVLPTILPFWLGVFYSREKQTLKACFWGLEQ